MELAPQIIESLKTVGALASGTGAASGSGAGAGAGAGAGSASKKKIATGPGLASRVRDIKSQKEEREGKKVEEVKEEVICSVRVSHEGADYTVPVRFRGLGQGVIDGGKTQHWFQARSDLLYDTDVPSKWGTMHDIVSFTVKFQGECGVLTFERGAWRAWKRLDAKPGKPLPEGAEPVLSDEYWAATGRVKRMYLVPVDTSGKRNHQYNAVRKLMPRLSPHLTVVSVENMGPKLQACACDPLPGHFSIPHGCVVADIPGPLRTPGGIRAVLAAMPYIEGFVVHTRNFQRFKIRQDGFGHVYPPKKVEASRTTGFAADVVRILGMEGMPDRP